MRKTYAGALLLDDYFLQLLDKDEDKAMEFRNMFWQMTTDKGLIGKRFPKKDVIDFINEYKNGSNTNDTI